MGGEEQARKAATMECDECRIHRTKGASAVIGNSCVWTRWMRVDQHFLSNRNSALGSHSAAFTISFAACERASHNSPAPSSGLA